MLIDLDPQGNASQWFDVPPDAHGTYELLTTKQSVRSLLIETSTPNVSILASSRSLVNIEKALAGELSVETRLKRRLSHLGEEEFDFFLIDTPPTLGLLTLNALSAAQQVLIPVTTHVMTLSGVAQLMQTLDEVRDILNPELVLLGLLPSRVDLRTRHSSDILEALIERFNDKVLSTIIRENIRLAEAPSFNKSILDYRPVSGAADDFRALALEIITLTN